MRYSHAVEDTTLLFGDNIGIVKVSLSLDLNKIDCVLSLYHKIRFVILAVIICDVKLFR